MKKSKKIIALILSVIMLMPMFSVVFSVSAASEINSVSNLDDYISPTELISTDETTTAEKTTVESTTSNQDSADTEVCDRCSCHANDIYAKLIRLMYSILSLIFMRKITCCYDMEFLFDIGSIS